MVERNPSASDVSPATGKRRRTRGCSVYIITGQARRLPELYPVLGDEPGVPRSDQLPATPYVTVSFKEVSAAEALNHHDGPLRPLGLWGFGVVALRDTQKSNRLVNLIVRPRDVDSRCTSLAPALMAEDRNQAFTLGQNGQNAFKSTYSWESELPKLLEFYDRVLANRPAVNSARDFSSSDPQLG